MLRVFLTDRADKSLEEIVEYYLTEHSATRAAKVLQSIDEAFEKAAKLPFSFPVCHDLAEPQSNIRQIVVHNTFKVIYRVGSKQIEILEIFHGSRNDKLLKDLK